MTLFKLIRPLENNNISFSDILVSSFLRPSLQMLQNQNQKSRSSSSVFVCDCITAIKMVESGEQMQSPVIRKKTALMESNRQNMASLISPRFKSAAAMAGWDEEALLLAALIVEDTPDRDSKQKKRLVLNSKSPLSNSSR